MHICEKCQHAHDEKQSCEEHLKECSPFGLSIINDFSLDFSEVTKRLNLMNMPAANNWIH